MFESLVGRVRVYDHLIWLDMLNSLCFMMCMLESIEVHMAVCNLLMTYERVFIKELLLYELPF